MSDRATLLALAERVEQASGPDLELDRRIDHARWPVKQPAYHLELSLRDHWDVPAFTSSLDAALSLVQGVSCFIDVIGDIVADGLPGCGLCISTDPVRHVWGVARGGGGDQNGRLARAATAAALRALASGAPR